LPQEHNLYRPRHSAKQRTALVCAVVFFLAPALSFVLGVRAEPFENRELHDFPSLADGWSFFTDLPAWATDHLPLREAGVEAADAVGTGLFGDPPGAQSGARSGTAGVQPEDEPKQVVPRDLYPRVISGKDDWLFLGEDIASKCFPVMDVDHVVAALNKLRHAVEASGRKFVLVVAPNKTTAMPERLPDDYVGKECAAARSEEFWRRIPAETGAIDLREPLRRTAEQLDTDTYSAVDSHWNFAGGLTMTYAVAEQISPGITRTWQIEQGKLRDWPADLVRLLGRSETWDLHEYTLAPDGKEDLTRYIASDFKVPLRTRQFGEEVTGVYNGNVGVVADSFTQFASPFLAATNRNLLIAHSDIVASGDAHQIAELLGDRDVVVFEFVERILANGGSSLLRDDVIGTIGKALADNPR
jgi:alginate O-acetyltransferase complex protein AlgJ